MKDTIKSIVWGLLLLFFILMSGLSAFKVYVDITDRYTSEKVSANLSFKKNVEEDLGVLKDHMEAVWLKNGWSPYSDELVQSVVEIVRRKISKCDGCSYFSFSTPNYPSEVDSFISDIDRETNPKKIEEYNQLRNYGLVFALLNFVVYCYLLAGLLRYKKMGFIGLAIFFLTLLPIALITSTLATVHPDYKWHHLQLMGEGLPIAFAIVAMFVIYPAVYTLCRKKGVKIGSVLKLNRL